MISKPFMNSGATFAVDRGHPGLGARHALLSPASALARMNASWLDARENALLTLQQADAHYLFGAPVRECDAPGYAAAITQPMDLSTVRAKLHRYGDNAAFCADVRLIYANARAWNEKRTKVFGEAKRMETIASAVFAKYNLDGTPDSSRGSSGRSTPIDFTSSSGSAFHAAFAAVLRAISDTDVYHMFEQTVSVDESELYGHVIKRAVSLASLAEALAEQRFACSAEGKARFVDEIELMFSNALLFNKKGSALHTESLRVRDVARTAIAEHVDCLKFGGSEEEGEDEDDEADAVVVEETTPAEVTEADAVAASEGAAAAGATDGDEDAQHSRKRRALSPGVGAASEAEAPRAAKRRRGSSSSSSGGGAAAAANKADRITRSALAEKLRFQFARLARLLNTSDTRNFFAKSPLAALDDAAAARYRSVICRSLDLGAIRNRVAGGAGKKSGGGACKSASGGASSFWSYAETLPRPSSSSSSGGRSSRLAGAVLLDAKTKAAIILTESAQFQMDLQLVWRNAAIWSAPTSDTTAEAERLARFATEQLEHSGFLVDPLLCALLPDRGAEACASAVRAFVKQRRSVASAAARDAREESTNFLHRKVRLHDGRVGTVTGSSHGRYTVELEGDALPPVKRRKNQMMLYDEYESRAGAAERDAASPAATPPLSASEDVAAVEARVHAALDLAASLEPAPLNSSAAKIREIFREMWKCDTMGIFRHPVSERVVPGYDAVIKQPMDLCTVAWKVMRGAYASDAAAAAGDAAGHEAQAQKKRGKRVSGEHAFFRDVSLVFKNAMQFNDQSSLFYTVAAEALRYLTELVASTQVSLFYFMYRYISCESCSQFDSLPLTYFDHATTSAPPRRSSSRRRRPSWASCARATAMAARRRAARQFAAGARRTSSHRRGRSTSRRRGRARQGASRAPRRHTRGATTPARARAERGERTAARRRATRRAALKPSRSSTSRRPLRMNCSASRSSARSAGSWRSTIRGR